MQKTRLSYSKIATARGCWKKYKFKYIDGLIPISKPSYLTLGKLIHEAFEMYYKGSTNEECLKYIVKEFDEAISKCEMFDQEDFVIAKYTAIGMWTYYPQKDLTEFQEINPELEFEVSVPKMRGVTYHGYVDGLIKRDGFYFVRECKTTGLSQRQFDGRARTSGQATGYVWAMKQLGYDVKGIMFDTIRKPLLRKGKSETMDTFGMRIIQDYKARPDHYYKRVWSYRSDEELDLFLEDIVEFTRQMRRVTKRQGFYRNPDQCWNFNSECPYLKVCFTNNPDPLAIELLYTKEGGDYASRKATEANKGNIQRRNP